MPKKALQGQGHVFGGSQSFDCGLWTVDCVEFGLWYFGRNGVANENKMQNNQSACDLHNL